MQPKLITRNNMLPAFIEWLVTSLILITITFAIITKLP